MRPHKQDELVRKALDVFYRSGFHTAEMDKPVGETGVSKTSMYKQFRTKDDLIIAVLPLRDENFRNWLYGRMEDLSDTPAGQLIAPYLPNLKTHPSDKNCGGVMHRPRAT
ncbi:TetR/AcrR family transcriptional regulator [Leisingera sp. HS039]|nr:TetR/AcrR family transcriptional regulator [Leisingera sp. HS039]QBR35531.1 TetR/AcrR family transcriptional regulator [Leisingera sp. NJS201]